MSEKLLRVVILAVACLSLFATRVQGQDDATWQGGNGNFSDSNQWVCSGPDFLLPVHCVPNGPQFDIDLGNGGTLNINNSTATGEMGNAATATLSMNHGSLTLAGPLSSGDFQAVNLSNGALINATAFVALNTVNLTMQNSTISIGETDVGTGSLAGNANISNSTVQKLQVAGGFSISNSTLNGDTQLITSTQGSILGTMLNGLLVLDGSASVTLDGGSTFHSSVSGFPAPLTVGLSPGSSPTLTIQGGSTFNASGANLVLGGPPTTTGTLVLNDTSSVTANNESIGQLGTGQFTQNGGTNTSGGTVTFGSQAGSSGTYNLSVGRLSADTEIIGDGGTGTFTQSSGDNIIDSQLGLGNMKGASGTYDLVNGLMGVDQGCLGPCASDTVIVGNGGNGTFTQTAGVVSIGGSLTIGLKTGSVGSYTQSGGTNNVNGNLNLGTDTSAICVTTGFGCSAGQGTYTLSGNGALTVGGLGGEQVGFAGTGEFDQKGGTNVGQGNLFLGGSGGTGTYNLSAGSLSIAGREIIAPGSGIGIFNQTGGMNVVPTLVNGGPGNPGQAVYNLSGGTLSASVLNDGTFTYSGGALNGNFSNQADGNFRIEGPGTRVINGTLANAGTVTVFAQQAQFIGTVLNTGVWHSDPSTNIFQTLQVGATGSITGVAGDVFQIKGDFQNLSTQNTLWDTSLAELEFSGAGTHTFDLAGQNGAGFANNFAWGTLVIDAGTILALGTGSGDAQYVNFLQGLDISGNLITNIDGAAGLFIYYNAADNPSLNGNYNLTGGGELIAADGPAATPEPATLLLMAGGLGSLIARRRWRRNESSSSSH